MTEPANEPETDDVWCPVRPESRARFDRELAAEIGPGHPLDGAVPEVLERCLSCDEVLVRFGGGRWAMVHLTWSSSRQPLPWPETVLASSEGDARRLQAEHARGHVS